MIWVAILWFTSEVLDRKLRGNLTALTLKTEDSKLFELEQQYLRHVPLSGLSLESLSRALKPFKGRRNGGIFRRMGASVEV